MNAKTLCTRISHVLGAAALTALGTQAGQAATLNLSDSPLFLTSSSAPLNMLVIGRDHKLYYEAYNDASDLNNDGVIDVGYKPNEITYFGLFDSTKCYSYDEGTGQFNPVGTTANLTVDKRCTAGDWWSGDFLNYLTTARIDALRKVLYGGSRYSDTTSGTVLQRTHIPQDAHSWGKEYESVARDGYNISEYSPLGLPTSGTRHLFANTTQRTDSDQRPRLRVLQNRANRIWEWVSIERPVANDAILTNGTNTPVSPQNFTVRVAACVTGFVETNYCRQYPNGVWKPIGLLQQYGENDQMLFGLLTGSYEKNTSGGVLRKRVGTLTDEINANTGQFLNVNGVIRTLDRFRTVGFATDYTYNDNCGWITDGPITQSQCSMWGNPVGEMMYEALRYFAGRGSATSAFATSGGDDDTLGLPHPSWDNPYSNANRSCAKPFQTVISDINPSYDSDQLPGSKWGGISSDIPGSLNVRNLGNTIWNREFGAASRHYIGEVEASDPQKGAPTAKDVTGFGEIRGLSPEEPTKLGSYYSASVAYHGFKTDLNSATGEQKVQTFAVALASPLPRIEIPLRGGRVTLIPFAKSVGGCLGATNTPPPAGFQPTNTIVDFYAESPPTATQGRFRVNFEDVEQGADHDMDAIVIYEYTVNADGTLTVTLTSEYAAGCIIQHIGYVISGTTTDGTYLEVRDLDTAVNADVDYVLDTPNVAGALPTTRTRTFTVGATPGATLLKDPLYYAAKWGGFRDSNGNDVPDVRSEWDEDPANSPGYDIPDNYFLVTNALTLGAQLSRAFDEIIERVGTAASASVNSGAINSETRLFQAKFNSGDWTGELLSYKVLRDGSFAPTGFWNAANSPYNANTREIVTVNTNGTAVPFRWDPLDATRKSQLQPADALGPDRLAYLRGNPDTRFRERRTALGDIINSSPAFVGRPPFIYSDTLESVPYNDYRADQDDRVHMVYVGGNDGMLHAFEAETGREVFAFIPSPVFRNLHHLTSVSYTHRYYVDGSPMTGDVFYGGNWHTVLLGSLNKGGQGIFALDVTEPGALRESSASDVFLWEFTDANDRDLGYTFSRPTIVRMNNGRWAAVFGNGYDNTALDGTVSTTGNAVLYIVDIETGALLRKIDTGVGMAQDPRGLTRPNGLATPVLVDLNSDSIVDAAYAGDLFGNLWKFDLGSATPASWDVKYKAGATNLPIFVARDSANRPQPITSRPNVSRGPRDRGLLVVFGTGKYLEPVDENVATATPQTFYAVLDPNTGDDSDRVLNRTSLTQQTIETETTVDTPSGRVNARVTTANSAENTRGWYLDLISPVNGFEGEMQVTDSLIRNRRVLFTTLIPNADPCSFGGRSWLMELDLFNGSRLSYTPLDLNQDGSFNDSDYVEVPLPSGGTARVPVSGVETAVGVTPKPTILSTNDTQDTNGDGVIDERDTPGGGGNPCDIIKLAGSSGAIQQLCRNAGPRAFGRQSWQQLR